MSPRPVIARCVALVIAAVGSAVLAGCSGFFPGAPLIPVEFQSTPSGAEARTSMGQSCKTPCSISVPAPEDDFTVSFTANGFHPLTIPVRITRTAGSALTPPSTSINPNPVIAQLEPLAPPSARAQKKNKPPAAQ
ncbi:MAG: hypothetical protein ABSG88_19650 [Bradyrhizobium sp.]